jgi:hypothetical protein
MASLGPRFQVARSLTSPTHGTAPSLLSVPYAPVRLVRRPTEYVKRRAFFSFHFDDIMRVNNVRNAFKVWYPGDQRMPTFYDSSLWGQRELTTDDAVKRLIREGVEYTSVVCVLAGTETWNRRWVRYEIARSVIDRKGLLVVDINGINHHVDRAPHALGRNPLDYMAVGAPGDGTYRLFERKSVWTGSAWEWRWKAYADYSGPVALPIYLAAPLTGYASPLSSGTTRHDYARTNGRQNIGWWIDAAAKAAGR